MTNETIGDSMSLKNLFQLDPNVIFLNHGSFGATPKEVFAVYQEWQRRLEHQPVKFLGREVQGYLTEARASLGQYLNADKDDLTFVMNATTGVNIVARSLNLKDGDEVLASDHEYGACNNTWTYLSQRQGFTYKQVAVPLPIKSNREMLEAFWQGVTPKTKVIFLSHITSPTAD
jgi:isopenicillin-N epimerase